MRILFVYPDISSSMSTLFNFGIGYMSAVLKREGHKTELCHLRAKSDVKKLFKVIHSFSPDLIAFSSVTGEFQNVREISKEIKDKFDIFVICGGIHPTLDPDCLEGSEGLDAICRGEGEYAILELVEKMERGVDYLDTRNFWFKKRGKIIKNHIRPLITNLDELPYPDREIVDYQKIIDETDGRAEFLFNRGCPFDCPYCCNPALRALYRGIGKYVRQRGVEKALNEVEQVVEKYKVKYWTSEDSLFSLNKKWVLEFCAGYKKRFKDLPFNCLVRVETCDAEIFKSLKEAGCFSVSFGVESGNPWLRKEVLKRNMTNEEIKQSFRLAAEHGLETAAHNMVGLPYEDVEKFEDTIEINRKIKPTDSAVHIFQPYPGTALGDLCIKNGWIKEDISDNFIAHLVENDTILDLPTFKREEIIECYRKFNYELNQERFIPRIIYSKVGYAIYRNLGLENPRHPITKNTVKLLKWMRGRRL